MRRICTRAALIAAVALSLASAQNKRIPQLVKTGGKFSFLVDGKPFLILGGQVGNFSAFPDRMERAWPKLKAMNANVVEYPVYWNVIEPQEGQFDFKDFDAILRAARAQGLRVDMLWLEPGRTAPWTGLQTGSSPIRNAFPE